MSAERNLNPQDYELLSAYIDGELSAVEQSALEQRLAEDTRLHQEYTSLRNMVRLVNQLPTLKAPRDYTLTQAMVAPVPTIRVLPKRPKQPAYLSLVASVVIMLFGAVFVFSDLSDVIPPTTGSSEIAMSAPASENPVVAVQTEELQLGENTASEPEDIFRERLEDNDEPETFMFSTADEPPADADVAPSPATSNSGGANDATLNMQAPPVTDDGFMNSGAASDTMAMESAVESGDADHSERTFEATTDTEADLFNEEAELQMMQDESAEELSDSTTLSAVDDSQTLDQANETVEEDSSDGEFEGVIGEVSGSDTTVLKTQATDIDPTIAPTLAPVPAESAEQRQQVDASTNGVIVGIGLLVVGILIFIGSALVIRRR